MAGNKYINSNSGVLTEVTAVQSSTGVTDAGKIVALDDNGKLNASLGLGDKVDKVTGKSLVEDTKVTAYDAHLVNTSNPHGVTASQIGAYSTSESDTLLGEKVDKVTGKGLSTNDLTNELLTLLNTNKVKNVTTDAVNNRLVITYTDDTTSELTISDIIADTYVSATNIKTINGVDIIGSGNIEVQPTLVNGVSIKMINGISILGEGNMEVAASGSVSEKLIDTYRRDFKTSILLQRNGLL